MDYYQILRLSRTATSEQIQHQYNRIKSYYRHKSSSPSSSPLSSSPSSSHPRHVPSRINTAYETLMNPVLRSEYDRNLSIQKSGVWNLISEPLELIKSCYLHPDSPPCSDTQIQSYHRTVQSNDTTRVAGSIRHSDKESKQYKQSKESKQYKQSYDVTHSKKPIRHTSDDSNSDKYRCHASSRSESQVQQELTRLLAERKTIDRAIERLEHKLNRLR